MLIFAIMHDVAEAPSKLAEKLKLLIHKHWESQSQLARELSVPPQRIQHYIRGTTPPLKVLLYIARKSGVTVDWLIDDEATQLPNASQSDMAKVSFEEVMNEVGQRYEGYVFDLLKLIESVSSVDHESLARKVVNKIESGASVREISLDLSLFYRLELASMDVGRFDLKSWATGEKRYQWDIVEGNEFPSPDELSGLIENAIPEPIGSRLRMIALNANYIETSVSESDIDEPMNDLRKDIDGLKSCLDSLKGQDDRGQTTNE